MPKQFHWARQGDDPALALKLMREKQIRQVPVLDDEGRIVGLHTLLDLTAPPRRDNWVVLMAGGLGQRLRPLTENCPKPLLEVGGKPVLETIMKQFAEYGFHRFFISVNYRAEMIRRYFGDGSRFDIEIEYIQEDRPLGTAGALGLLPSAPEEPVFVMNGDVLSRLDFPGMLKFHEEHQAMGTMAVRDFEIQIPYGVVEVQDDMILRLSEKPRQHFFVNAGIYVLSPETLRRIPANEYLDMPTLFEQLRRDGQAVSAFPIHEYWMDIGSKQDFEQANYDYCAYFK